MTNPKPLDWSGNLRARNTVTGEVRAVELHNNVLQQPDIHGDYMLAECLPDNWWYFDASGHGVTGEGVTCPWIIEQADEGAGEGCVAQEARDPRADFAPCPTCGQYSHSIGDDAIAKAYLHFQSMVCEHPMKAYPTSHMFQAQTRDMAEVLVAAIRARGPDLLAQLSTPDPRDALIAEMREALEPFVALADKVEAKYRKRGGNPDNFSDGHASFDISARELTLGDFRRARATLTRAKEQVSND